MAKPRGHAWWQDRAHRWTLLGYLVLAALLVHDWDGYVFRTAVTQFWHGHSPYAVAQTKPAYAFLNPADTETQWYAYPPVPLLAMAISYAPALALHLPDFVGRILLKLPMLVGTLALGLVAAAWTRRLGGSEGDVRQVERRFLWNPYLVLVGVVWGMTDTILMALYMGGILAYRNGRFAKAGILVALATLVKPFPALLLLAIIPYLLECHGWPAFRRFVVAASLTGAALVAPFALAQPVGFWRQAVGMHLSRPPQGATPWTIPPLDHLPPGTIAVASIVLMALSLLGVGLAAVRMKGRGTAVLLTLLGAIAVLFWNRVLNEQYLVLVVAPLLVLDQAHQLDRLGHFLTRWAPGLFAALIVLGGFHFLTFIPPDEAMPLFGKAVDAVADDVRQLGPSFWWWLQHGLEWLVTATLVALAALAVRLMLVTHRAGARAAGLRRHAIPPLAACGLLLALGVAPALAGPAHDALPPFAPAYAEPRVAAFYYLWWQNPSHDPAVRYGNWGPVSQDPAIGFYSFNRGIARDHAKAMVAAGIDTAIVSYHRGEMDRYKVFQQEAHKAGLRVVPLIELNQIYDQAAHHPRGEDGSLQPFAGYRMDAATRQAIVDFTLDLGPSLQQPSSLRLDGRPVVMYYDSYTSIAGYDPADKENLADVLVDTVPIQALRSTFNDSSLPDPAGDATTRAAARDALVAHYPPSYLDFFAPGPNALWRQAHMEEHRRFWLEVRQSIETVTGPLFLVSGEAFNERAGFQTGTIKGLADLEVLDGVFIYSPSFTWGNLRDDPFNQTFARYEDRNRWATAYAAGAGRASVFGIAPSYDDTVNRPTGFRIPAPPDGRSFYQASWDSTLVAPPTLTAIATWNEYFEGSSIEANTLRGTQDLEVTRQGRQRLEAFASDPVDSASRNATLVVDAPDTTTLVLTHEWDSRTQPGHPETDAPHLEGLQLIASTYRAGLAPAAAVDATSRQLGDLDPYLLLVDGGRADYGASSQVLAHLDAWRAHAPTLVFGPEVAQPLAHLVAACAGPAPTSPLVGAPSGPRTLQPGDAMHAEAAGLVLVRSGNRTVVGQACGPDVAYVAFKPWADARDDDGTCLAVAVRALAPSRAPTGAPASCVYRAL